MPPAIMQSPEHLCCTRTSTKLNRRHSHPDGTGWQRSVIHAWSRCEAYVPVSAATLAATESCKAASFRGLGTLDSQVHGLHSLRPN